LEESKNPKELKRFLLRLFAFLNFSTAFCASALGDNPCEGVEKVEEVKRFPSFDLFASFNISTWFPRSEIYPEAANFLIRLLKVRAS
jgi:hypothetical protein